MSRLACLSAVLLILALTGCVDTIRPGTLLERRGDEIVACGQLFHIGTPVVLWTDPGGYDAYRVEKRFDRTPTTQPEPARYGTWRRGVDPEIDSRIRERGWDLASLQRHVDLFVIHYDVCGTSEQCFKVLHDLRTLSVHFMLDLDGTIYQTLDLKERAWHAAEYNDRSVGIEIANIGAYPVEQPATATQPAAMPKTLAEWYADHCRRCGWPIVTLPAAMGDGGILTPNFVATPARREPVVGSIHGRPLMQYDLTPQQYEALIRLTAGLSRVLPRIRLEVPRDSAGRPRTNLLSAEEMKGYNGLVGHYHLTERKIDPGPAFDWDRVIEGARRTLR